MQFPQRRFEISCVIVSPTQDDFPDDGIETEACERKCTTDADCATKWPEFNECGVCQNWGDDPDMECDGTPRPDQPVTIKNAHISLVRVPRPSPSHRVESASVGEIYNIQRRSRTARSAWACGQGCAGGEQTDGTCGCACQCRSGMPAELRNSDGPCKLGGKEITIQNGDGLCVAASGTKNGKRIIAEKCKAGSSKQQWQIGPM